MPKKNTYRNLLKKAVFNANPQAAKFKKKEKIKKMANKMSNKMTNPEMIFSNMMKEIGVDFEAQKIVGNKIFDFYIPSKNLIVEVHGDYWHSNPLIYEEKDLNKTQIKNLRNDIFKETLVKGMGYSMEIIWEYDLINNYQKQKNKFIKILKNE